MEFSPRFRLKRAFYFDNLNEVRDGMNRAKKFVQVIFRAILYERNKSTREIYSQTNSLPLTLIHGLPQFLPHSRLQFPPPPCCGVRLPFRVRGGNLRHQCISRTHYTGNLTFHHNFRGNFLKRRVVHNLKSVSGKTSRPIKC